MQPQLSILNPVDFSEKVIMDSSIFFQNKRDRKELSFDRITLYKFKIRIGPHYWL